MINDSRYKEIKIYKKEKLEEFYSYYIKNLSLIPFKTQFVHPKNMHLRQLNDRGWIIDSLKDAYINEAKNDRTLLAKEILQNGTYWPIWLYKENDDLIVSEGIHRIDSIKQLIELNKWGDKELFSIIIPKELDVSEGNEKSFDVPIKPIYVYMPVFNIEDKDLYYYRFKRYIVAYRENIDRFHTMKKDGCIKVKINNFLDYFYTFKIYHKFLRHAFYKYKLNNNDLIPTYDYSQFEKKGSVICIKTK